MPVGRFYLLYFYNDEKNRRKKKVGCVLTPENDIHSERHGVVVYVDMFIVNFGSEPSPVPPPGG